MFNIWLVQIAELCLFKYKNTPNKQTPQASRRSPSQNQKWEISFAKVQLSGNIG